MRHIINKAKADPKRIVLPEGEHEKILRAAQIMIEEGIAVPVLLGNRRKIGEKIEELQLGLNGVTIIDPDDSPDTERYAQVLFELRQRRGSPFPKPACW
jgi:malate dehydrogenase (oxaloacetate-decarboxylating)(NADP+)